MLAGVAALAATPLAHAQNGFPDYRQATADQYPAQPPPASTSGSGAEPTSGSSGRPRPVHPTSNSGISRRRHGAASPAGSGGAPPVAVPAKPVPVAKGSLPFTGSDLSGLVVLALLLIAAGLLAGAVARATRRRRRHAPAG